MLWADVCSFVELIKDWNNMLINDYRKTKNNRSIVMKIDKRLEA